MLGGTASAAAPTKCDTTGVATLADLSVTGGTVVGVCGFFDKNKVGDADTIDFALDQLGLAYDGTSLSHIASNYSAAGTSFLSDLGVSALYGDIYVAFHTGAAAPWGNSTAFFHIVAGPGGVTAIVPNTNGLALSNATLFDASLTPPTRPSVPEPATWAMMLIGFGMIGFALRDRRTSLAA
ncbi:PEPxxWA-CTERM sorting domain-containing protein [Sphingomonas quercus]|nr:PEPxxWA-CTERM sorting domain-containing protein [Sphingomonas quercus]